ncbi:hypothetical protein [Veillonella agrestimuris]|uniref:hypothetical protein n=1 Tax=Veillonella agrestimuris TaxID=2941340 RepID=UPI002041C34B|nr:hypothetical protein [Veillonella agrestimuris]
MQYVNKILRKIHIADKKLERVGHKDHRTTLSVYTHVSKAAKQEVIDKLNTFVI